ncbi:transposase, partial [Escherichia sp. WS1620]|uniref:transposase n=1 Tax=Escherichia sp. WS1620 TaxID=3381944 RepID=UPI00396F66BD
QNDVTLKMPAFEWVHVQLHQQKGMISLSPPTICNSARHSVSNGNAEALNSKIRLLRIKARGYRNRERFKLGVMFHYGKLNMAF